MNLMFFCSCCVLGGGAEVLDSYVTFALSKIRFHVAVRLFGNTCRSQMTSKCGKNKKVAEVAKVRH